MTTILVTGSRDYQGDLSSHIDQISDMVGMHFLSDDITLIHGGANGVDTIAAAEGVKRGWMVNEYVARWDIYGKSAGPKRNATMVAQNPHLAFAALSPDSIGTRDCLKKLANSTVKNGSRLRVALILNIETGSARWLYPQQLLEEFG